MKDPQLDQLLSEFRNKVPTELQVRRWTKQVQSELNSQTSKGPQWTQVLVASVVGFALGALCFGWAPRYKKEENFAENLSPSATTEYVLVKTD